MFVVLYVVWCVCAFSQITSIYENKSVYLFVKYEEMNQIRLYLSNAFVLLYVYINNVQSQCTYIFLFKL